MVHLFDLPGFEHLFTDSLDPNIAVMKFTKRCLHSGHALGIRFHGSTPSILKQFDGITRRFAAMRMS